MAGRVALSPAARADLVQHVVYLNGEAGQAVADRFLLRAQHGFELLADNPMLGPAVLSKFPALAEVRKWRVKDFKRFLLFYMPIENGIQVLRVLGARQDWWSLLGLED